MLGRMGGCKSQRRKMLPKTESEYWATGRLAGWQPARQGRRRDLSGCGFLAVVGENLDGRPFFSVSSYVQCIWFGQGSSSLHFALAESKQRLVPAVFASQRCIFLLATGCLDRSLRGVGPLGHDTMYPLTDGSKDAALCATQHNKDGQQRPSVVSKASRDNHSATQ